MNRTALLIVAILTGLLIGGLLGELVAYFLPTGVVKTFFMKSINFGFKPVEINLAVISFTIGFQMKFNFVSLVAVILTIYYFKWWL